MLLDEGFVAGGAVLRGWIIPGRFGMDEKSRGNYLVDSFVRNPTT